MIGGGTWEGAPHVRHAAARVHHAARRRGRGVAAGGVAAAARADAVHRRRLGGLEIDHQLVFHRRLHRQVVGLLTLEDTREDHASKWRYKDVT